MARSKPVVIYLEEEVKRKLKELAEKEKYRSVSEYVRRLIIRELKEKYLIF